MEIRVRSHDEREGRLFGLGLVAAHHVWDEAGARVFGYLYDAQWLAVHGGRTPFDEVAYGFDDLGVDAGVFKCAGRVGIPKKDVEGFVVNNEWCCN